MRYFVADRCVWLEFTGRSGAAIRQTFLDVLGHNPRIGWCAELGVYITHID